MTLSAPLAIALAVLAALSVVAVAVIGYAATDQGLRGQVDASLISSARQLPLGDAVCQALAQGQEGPIRDLGGPVAGLIVQCLDANGRGIVSLGPSHLPMDQPGVDVTPRSDRKSTRL